MDDLWDGRLIYFIFANAVANKPILPYRLQMDFAKAHDRVGFKEALVTDENDTLLTPDEDVDVSNLLINKCVTFPVQNDFVDLIFRGDPAVLNIPYNPGEQADCEKLFRSALKWRFLPVEDRLLQLEPKVQLTTFELKRQNRTRQRQSRWYVIGFFFEILAQASSVFGFAGGARQ